MTEKSETGRPSLSEEERTVRDKLHMAVLGMQATDTPRQRAERRMLRALAKGYKHEVVREYDELIALEREIKETEPEGEFSTLAYEMSEEDLYRLREYLAGKRIEAMKINDEVRSSLPGSKEKPHFVLKNAQNDSEVDFELFAASYKHGKAILLAHPEYNQGWGCAIAIGWEDNKGEAEGKRIDFGGLPDVIMSALPLLKKYEIDK